AIRHECKALQVGDYLPLAADSLFAFLRRTASVRDTVVVLANPGHKTVTEPVCPRESWLLDSVPLRDLVGGGACKMQAGRIEAKVPPRTVQMWVVDREDPHRYSFLKRVP
ncbi:MAG: hypothetical protein FJZ00_14875, partial [Candidatus Sericytochromatia bacterium]|nr:hypothetical protein [Candidatus Tanganyikabacteria bacterium]